MAGIAERAKEWARRWKLAIERVKAWGGEGSCKIGPPATHSEVDAAERRYGVRFPEAFRAILTEFSGKVWVEWELVRDDVERVTVLGGSVPYECQDIGRGHCSWDLSNIPWDGHQRDIKRWRLGGEHLWSGMWPLWRDNGPIVAVGTGAHRGVFVLLSPVVNLRFSEDVADFFDALSALACVDDPVSWTDFARLGDVHEHYQEARFDLDGGLGRPWREWFWGDSVGARPG